MNYSTQEENLLLPSFYTLAVNPQTKGRGREKVVRRVRRRRAGGKWPPEGHRLKQATS